MNSFILFAESYAMSDSRVKGAIQKLGVLIEQHQIFADKTHAK